MSDHLPECPVPDMDGLWGLPMHPEDAKANCICPSLRACEQRAGKEAADRVMSMRYRVDAGWQEMKEARAYATGVQAARGAVAALEPLLDVTKSDGGYDCCGCVTPGYLWTDALAAIDALMVGRSGNSDTPPSAEKGEKP